MKKKKAGKSCGTCDGHVVDPAAGKSYCESQESVFCGEWTTDGFCCGAWRKRHWKEPQRKRTMRQRLMEEDWSGKTIEEIAEELGSTYGSVYTTICYTKRDTGRMIPHEDGNVRRRKELLAAKQREAEAKRNSGDSLTENAGGTETEDSGETGTQETAEPEEIGAFPPEEELPWGFAQEENGLTTLDAEHQAIWEESQAGAETAENGETAGAREDSERRSAEETERAEEQAAMERLEKFCRGRRCSGCPLFQRVKYSSCHEFTKKNREEALALMEQAERKEREMRERTARFCRVRTCDECPLHKPARGYDSCDSYVVENQELALKLMEQAEEQAAIERLEKFCGVRTCEECPIYQNTKTGYMTCHGYVRENREKALELMAQKEREEQERIPPEKPVSGETAQIPADDFRVVAELWNAYLRGALSAGEPISGKDVACMLGLVDIARIAVSCDTAESFAELAGFAAWGRESATNGETVG